MKKSRFTDSQIIAVLKEAEAGTPVPELCRSHGISSATFYKWRSKFGGMDVSLMTRMKELEEENRRLKKLYVEAQLSADLLRESLAKKMVRPAQRRALAQHAVQTNRTTIQHACVTFGISETCYRHQGRRGLGRAGAVRSGTLLGGAEQGAEFTEPVALAVDVNDRDVMQ